MSNLILNDAKPWRISAVCAIVLYLRLTNLTVPFSYDYGSYLWIIRRVSELQFSEIADISYGIPYTDVGGLIRIEFGFSLLVKALSVFIESPGTIYAIIASASLAIRAFAMRSLGVPVIWIVWINLFALTLMEANALRFGIATSLLILSLYHYKAYNFKISSTLGLLAVTIHLQTIIFILLAIFSIFGSAVFKKSPLWIATSVILAAFLAFASSYVIMSSGNEKVQEYVYNGSSGSSGFTLTSVLALLLVSYSSICLIQARAKYVDAQMFYIINFTCLPSVLLLMFLTNVAVIGDRLWQMNFLIYSTFVFTRWTSKAERTKTLLILGILLAVMQINVLIRYPLSNMFSPPLPDVGDLNEIFILD